MGTTRELRVAGLAALATALLLGGALVLMWGGPPSTQPGAVLAWHAGRAPAVQGASVLWLAAMLSLVVFAVTLREATWATSADRSWATVLFLQGASVFAIVAVVAAALGWSLASQAAAGSIDRDLAGALWGVGQTLLRFATWGLTVPLAVFAVALARHSVLGQVCAVAAVFVAVALLPPVTWAVALHALPVWLLLAAITLLVPTAKASEQPVVVVEP